MKQQKRGQVILEFTFSMLVIMLMIYGLMMVFKWAGLDLANRRMAHEASLTNRINESYAITQEGPMQNIDPYFYHPTPLNAVWNER